MHPTKKRLREIAPERVYPLTSFQESSGLSPRRMREARLQGVHLETVDVGKRKFVRGSDGIEYILRLAERQADGDQAEADGDQAEGIK